RMRRSARPARPYFRDRALARDLDPTPCDRRSYRESAAEGRDSMSKKHFEWAARELAAAHLAGTFDAREAHAIKTFCATMFSRFNPRFDWGRFESRVDKLIADARRKERAA